MHHAWQADKSIGTHLSFVLVTLNSAINQKWYAAILEVKTNIKVQVKEWMKWNIIRAILDQYQWADIKYSHLSTKQAQIFKNFLTDIDIF